MIEQYELDILTETKKVGDVLRPLDTVVSRVCSRCGYIHGTDDARRVNRFSAKPATFMAKHGHTLRATREEAEKDECAWRIENNAIDR